MKVEDALSPWVLVSPDGVMYLGLHGDEASVWRIALGWPDEDEIDRLKSTGWYATKASLTWELPSKIG